MGFGSSTRSGSPRAGSAEDAPDERWEATLTASQAQEPTAPANGRRPRIERAWIIIGVVLFAAAAMALLGAFMAPERHSDMWVELVKSSIQIIVLAVAGGVVGAVLRDRDAVRDAELRRRAYFLAFLDQVDLSYGQVKSVRRMLRTYGFGQPRAGALTPQQVVGFRNQMAHLNDAEVAYEMHARKVAALAGRFGGAADGLEQALTGIHTYLATVLREWQADPEAISSRSDAAATGSWPHFSGFVDYEEAATGTFREGVADRMVTVELILGGMGAPPRK